jgi:LacI family transcriptional regulator
MLVGWQTHDRYHSSHSIFTAGRGAMQRTRRPTMKDVAARAGVGLKTVSRVVNEEPGVLPDTAALVRKAIDELGFRRNFSARQLRTGHTAGIGLVLGNVADPFFCLLAGAVEDVARAHGSLLLTASSDDDPERESELALALCSRRVDGLIVIPAAHDHTYLVPELDAGLAMVFVDRPPINLAADAVLVDNAAGARTGVRHLLAHGHRRIGYLGDAPHVYTSTQRLLGYRAAMAEAGAPVDERWIALTGSEPDLIRRGLDRLLAPGRGAGGPVTALFTATNRVTVATLRELSARGSGLSTAGPALVGFDDVELADLLNPAVTVVARDPVGLGRTGADLLFARLNGFDAPPRAVTLPTVLIPRGSGELPPRC